MASIRRQILIDAPPDDVWDAVRDFGAPHTRLVPGFATDSRLDGDTRIEWLVDLLPDGLADRFSDAMDLGAVAMTRAYKRPDL